MILHATPCFPQPNLPHLPLKRPPLFFCGSGPAVCLSGVELASSRAHGSTTTLPKHLREILVLGKAEEVCDHHGPRAVVNFGLHNGCVDVGSLNPNHGVDAERVTLAIKEAGNQMGGTSVIRCGKFVDRTPDLLGKAEITQHDTARATICIKIFEENVVVFQISMNVA